MNCLFLLPRFNEKKYNLSLEGELVKEFKRNNHEVSVVSLLEDVNEKIQLKTVDNIKLLKINCGKYYSNRANIIHKGFTSLKIPYIFPKYIKKYIKGNVDCIFFSTPMLNKPRLIKKLINFFPNSKIFLIVWDIFPQNAVDLKIIKNRLLINYFTKSFKNSLLLADRIATMSLGNKDYLDKNFNISSDKLFVLKNWAEIKPRLKVNIKEIRRKYRYDKEDFIVIFGGNMGKPQALENILNLAQKSIEKKDIKYVFIGNGTEKNKLKKIKKIKKLNNVEFFDYISRDDYELFLGACDLGLVSLDERFTVPNFPSKTTDYFKLQIPILASLDKCSANDYGKFLVEEAKAGIFVQAGDTKKLYEELLFLYKNRKLLKEYGENGGKYYEENLGVDKAYKTIMQQYEQIVKS